MTPSLELNAESEFGEIRTPFRSFAPDWAIVLGSGLAPFLEAIEATATVPYADVRGIPKPMVPGHAGRFVFASIGQQRLLIAQGRVHLYEGFSAPEVTTFVRFFAAIGAKRILLTNAAGTLNPQFAPGEWMMLNDHLNLTGTSPLLGGPNFVDMSRVYCPKLRAHFASVADRTGMALHQGVYAGLLGPQYETPAEVRMIRTLGADAVGMSTVLEAIQAHAVGIPVAAFSCLTNWAAGMDTTATIHHDEVLQTGKTSGRLLAELLITALSEWPED